MSFTSPGFLWMMAALAPLAAAYFLKVRPRRFPVNALFLWDTIFQQKKASSLFQRLRDLISLLILALVVLAIVLAAAGPRPEHQDKRDLLLVVDTSPSMRAKSGNKDILTLAKDRSRDIIRALNGTRRAAIASASANLEFLSHASDSPKDLTDALALLRGSDTPVSPSTVAELNACARGAGSSGRVLLLTDGNRGWEGLDPSIEVIRLGEAAPNAGFLAADLDRKPGTRKGAVFYYRIGSTVKQETNAELELRHDDTNTLARLIPITLKPGEEASDTLEVEDAPAGRWTAELKFPDALATDNVVALGLAEARPVEIRVEAAQPYFFKRCLDAFANTGGLLAPVEQGGDLAITQGAPTKDRHQIIFAPNGDSDYWNSSSTGGAAIDVLAAETKVPAHPIVNHLQLEALRFEGARDIAPAPGSLVLASSETGKPLMWKCGAPGQEVLVVNLDPSKGDFFFSPAFPALVHGAALDLTGRQNNLRSTLPTGTTADPGGIVTAPDGSHPAPGPFTVTTRGHYLAETPFGVSWFGGALLDPAETMLDRTGPADSGAVVERGYPMSIWLLIAAATLLLVEYILYHRRKAG